ncbi:MAG: DUF2264 domain-containing protein [Bacillus sp. (in: Bacteria)]|nr:DUF2264 domain-containing protein [Bacillus sp. (in: firmicutes)]MCM1426564.1 DUF2264 domain-containing protein [Eubacterium sp.]
MRTDWEGKLNSKADFQELLMEIIRPLLPYYTKEKAGIDLGVTATTYEQSTIRLEAFSRILWGLVPFWAGGGNDAVFEEIYRKGLTAGTDPENPEYWGGFHAFDQRFVEMAAMAYGLILAPDKIWEPLSEKEKDNLADWLYGINEYELPICNWVLFAVLVNIALKKLGRKYDAEKLEKYLDGADSFYLGDGWYQDGDSGQKDYYISFAIHFYSLFYAKVMEKDDPERCALYKERANIFAQQFIYWFDENGASLPYGRSLTYRFSQVSFFCACLMAGVEPFDIGVMKGLIVRHFCDWMKKPFFDRNDILTIGYAYPNLVMGERYNGPGSPYWALKTFAVLMLPDEHPFWSAQIKPLPRLEEQKALPYADMLIHRYKNHVTAFVPGKYSPAGHGQIVAKYGKFAYDTRFGFSVAKSSYEVHEAAPDSMLAFFINGYVYVRRICEEFRISETEVYSRWVPYEGIVVETIVVPTKDGHIRKHKIISDRECEAYDCGFAVEIDVEGEKQTYHENTATVKNCYSMCQVTAKETDGEGLIIPADPNTNLLHPMTRIPAVRYRIQKGEQVLTTEVNAEYTREY